ncbi:MAG: hypothetical protein CMH26_05135 [Micavibrio sp.]|nr:hypothetical protein [Micavibrio sp.]|tara:strand:- start:2597 stop:3040 length:444 start_codon:yes stop_codon:yes gene_type:complete
MSKDEIAKKTSKVSSVIIFAIVALIFVGPRVYKYVQSGNIDYLEEKIGVENYKKLTNGLLPIGYAGFCLKELPNDPKIVGAIQNFNSRNEGKMKALVEALSANNLLSSEDKDILDKGLYKVASMHIKDGKVNCTNLHKRLNSDEWDL